MNSTRAAGVTDSIYKVNWKKMEVLLIKYIEVELDLTGLLEMKGGIRLDCGMDGVDEEMEVVWN